MRRYALPDGRANAPQAAGERLNSPRRYASQPLFGLLGKRKATEVDYMRSVSLVRLKLPIRTA